MTEDELKQLSNADLERLADSVQAEIDRRWRKREKQAVKDAMNTEPKSIFQHGPVVSHSFDWRKT